MALVLRIRTDLLSNKTSSNKARKNVSISQNWLKYPMPKVSQRFRDISTNISNLPMTCFYHFRLFFTTRCSRYLG